MRTGKQAAAELFGTFWLVFGGTGAAVLYVIASGKAGFTLSDGFAANGYGDHSPAGYTMLAAIVIELLLTFFFLFVIHGVTDRRAPAGRPGAAGQRPCAHPHPSHQHPAGQHVGEPRAQSSGARPLRGRLGAQPAVALHRVPDRGRGDRRSRVVVPA